MKFLKKNGIYLFLLLVLAVLIFVPSAKNFIKNKFLPIAEIENTLTVIDADYDIRLKGMNVPDTNLKNFKGKKLLFLNFWGTWCAPCLEEWPTIQKLYNSKKDKADFVLIAMMDKEDNVKKFLKENNYTVPVYIAESPINSSILPKLFPTTYLLDKNGRILQKEESSKDWNADSVHQFIENVSK